MSIHYLVDPTTPNADVIDVAIAEAGQTESTGAMIIQIQFNSSSDCLVVGNLFNASSGTGSVNKAGTGVGTHTIVNNELI